jgi:hypothetical protein
VLKKTSPSKKPRGNLHLDKRADAIFDIGEGDADDLLTETQMAQWFGVDEKWMKSARQRAVGPPFTCLDGLHTIRYRRGDARTWLKKRSRIHARKYKTSGSKNKA